MWWECSSSCRSSVSLCFAEQFAPPHRVGAYPRPSARSRPRTATPTPIDEYSSRCANYDRDRHGVRRPSAGCTHRNSRGPRAADLFRGARRQKEQRKPCFVLSACSQQGGAGPVPSPGVGTPSEQATATNIGHNPKNLNFRIYLPFLLVLLCSKRGSVGPHSTVLENASDQHQGIKLVQSPITAGPRNPIQGPPGPNTFQLG